MRDLNFSSWQTLLSTLFTLAVVTLIGVGVRLLLMQTVQHRRERANRQINERLRTLIAAYKTLGGSFTGNLAVDPTHLKDLKRASMAVPPAVDDAISALDASSDSRDPGKTERARRIRDSVEAALADIILLGTEEQVRLAAHAATEMVQGRPIHTAELVISLRDFIRDVLDLDAVPVSIRIPAQGPARPSGAKGKPGEDRGQGGKGEGGGAGLGGGGGTGGAGLHARHQVDDTDPHHPRNG
jgi:hypothetical protein